MPQTATDSPKKPRKTHAKPPEKEPERAEPHVPVSQKPFPAWPRSNKKGGLVPFKDLLDYWRGLAPEYINRTSFYVNREWPVLNRLQELNPEEQELVRLHKKKQPSKYIDKLVRPFESDDYRMEILRRYGSGDYKLYLNDVGVRGKRDDPDLEPRNLCKTVVSFHDPEFPPVLDPNRPDKGLGILDLIHPQNQSYVTELRLKGVSIPGMKEGETDMQAETVKVLTDQVSSLASKVAAADNDRLVERIAEKVNGGGTSQTSTFVEAVKLLKDVVTPPSASAESPILQAVVGLMTKQIEAAQTETRELRAELRDMRDKGVNAVAATKSNPMDMLKEGLGIFKEFAPTIKDMFPGLKDAAGAAIGGGRSKMGGWQEFLVQFGQPIISDIINSPVANALGQMMIMKATQPQNGNGGLGAAQLNPSQPNPAQITAGNPQPGAPLTIVKFFDMTWRPMMKGLRDEQTGDEFAALLFDYYDCPYEGLDWLNAARMAGPLNIVQAFKMSPYWAQIAALPNGEQRFTQFVTAFCSWMPPADEPEPTQGTEESEMVDLTQNGGM